MQNSRNRPVPKLHKNRGHRYLQYFLIFKNISCSVLSRTSKASSSVEAKRVRQVFTLFRLGDPMAQQCDQIWQFLIVFGDVPIFLGTKVAQIFGDIFGYNETRIILNKPAVTTFWTIFWKNKNWTTFYNIWSHL